MHTYLDMTCTNDVRPGYPRSEPVSPAENFYYPYKWCVEGYEVRQTEPGGNLNDLTIWREGIPFEPVAFLYTNPLMRDVGIWELQIGPDYATTNWPNRLQALSWLVGQAV
jgi:hypothetical protein